MSLKSTFILKKCQKHTFEKLKKRSFTILKTLFLNAISNGLLRCPETGYMRNSLIKQKSFQNFL